MEMATTGSAPSVYLLHAVATQLLNCIAFCLHWLPGHASCPFAFSFIAPSFWLSSFMLFLYPNS
jgi:hypothetical protein